LTSYILPRSLAWVLAGAMAVLSLESAAPAPAADTDAAGTLGKIAATHTITLGVRTDARPFAYTLPDGLQAGYAVDLCKALVDDVKTALGATDIAIKYVPVTPENRVEKVVSGAADIECGSTTRTQQRLLRVAFSPIFYVSGTKLIVRRGSTIQSYRDLDGKTVAVTAGTTNEIAMHELADRMLIRMKFLTSPDHEQSFAALQDGRADAFATDDILLAGLTGTPGGSNFVIVGDYLSYEPYGLMFRRDDPAFAAVIDSGFRRLAASSQLVDMYDRWFLNPLPDGQLLDVFMSAELMRVFHSLGQPE
jgi:glutamate/aspartate transport system substrate-binding protein